MEITLNDDEIKEGLVAFIATQGIDLKGKDVEVSLTAGRGPNGYSADIKIVPGSINAVGNINNNIVGESEEEVSEPEDARPAVFGS